MLNTKNKIEDRCCKINWNYAPIKAHYFLLYGGLGGTLPYIQVMAKDFGITSTDLGIVYTIVPLFICFSKPLFGFITDRLRNFRDILLMLLIMTALSFYAVLYIPPSKNNNRAVSLQVTPMCVEERRELIIELPPYNSACGREIMNNQIQCNFISELCTENKNLPGILTVSNILPTDKNISLAYTFRFKDNIPSQAECGCLNGKSSLLIGEIKISECESFKNIGTTSEYESYSICIFVLLVILSGAGSATLFCLTDAACNEVVSDNPRLFGNQRLWGTVSSGIMTLATGYLNDIASAGSRNANYSPGFYLMLVFLGVDMLLLCNLRLEKASTSTNICKDVRKIFASWQTIVFSLGVYISGALAGLLYIYEFWYLTELGSSQLLLGLTAAFQCLLSGVPFLFFSGWFIKKFGHFNCLIVSLAAYALRIGLYSTLKNPWMVLPIELLHGITYSIFLAAMTLYAAEYSPPGTEATMLGIFGGLFEGLGVATGSLLGGIGFDNNGGRWTFFAASMVSLLCVPFFTIAYKILQRYESDFDMSKNLTAYVSGKRNYGTQS